MIDKQVMRWVQRNIDLAVVIVDKFSDDFRSVSDPCHVLEWSGKVYLAACRLRLYRRVRKALEGAGEDMFWVTLRNVVDTHRKVMQGMARDPKCSTSAIDNYLHQQDLSAHAEFVEEAEGHLRWRKEMEEEGRQIRRDEENQEIRDELHREEEFGAGGGEDVFGVGGDDEERGVL